MGALNRFVGLSIKDSTGVLLPTQENCRATRGGSTSGPVHDVWTGWHRSMRSMAILVLGAIAVSQAVAGTSAQAAARRFKAASLLREDLSRVPKLELGLRQYELVVSAFEAVRRTDPTSGYCDDALLAIAELYEGMTVRFGGDKYIQKAIETYKLLAREYPSSRHREPALRRVASLSSIPTDQSRPAPPSPTTRATSAAGAPPGTVALSDTLHAPGSLVAPPGAPAPGGRATISQVRYHSYEDGTRVVLQMDGKASLKYDRLQRPDRLYIDIFGSAVSNALPEGATMVIDDSLIAAARLAQNRRNKARLVLDLRSRVSFDAFWLDEPTRLVLDVRTAGSNRAARTDEALSGMPGSPPTRTASPPPRAAAKTADGKLSLTRAMGLKSRRILIDAGHGGHDTGSVGAGGLQEKDVVLDIAVRLGELLSARMGAEVIQTRESDVFIELEERVRIANESDVDLMISIHCNAARQSSVRGIETYYLSLTTDPWALEVASQENASANFSVHQLDDLVSKITLGERTEESKDFATRIQSNLFRGLSRHSSRIRDRGIRKAPFVVLIGARIPAVLAEIGFISNRQDEQLMGQSRFREEVAEHLFQGISEYMRSLGTSTVSQSLSPGSSQQD